MTASLSVEGATVRFGCNVALDAVDFEVAAGEVVAVIGPSGCGKTTLLRAVAGLQPLDAGRVSVGGRDLAAVPVHQRDVGLMFQSGALFPHRDVAGNVGFGLRMQGHPPAQVATRVATLLELVGLPGAERRAVVELSGGEQQRVALARALAPEPSLLLLDEALGALDRTLRERLTADLSRLFGELGLTVVAVTHDQREAFALGDRIVVMDAGRIVQVGPPAEVWERPAGARAAHLLGLGNVLAVVVRGGAAVTPWGELRLPGPDGTAAVLVRPAGVVPDPSGAVSATVVASTFQGSHTLLDLDVPGGPPLQAEVPTPGAPARGTNLRIRIDPVAVVRLEP